MNYKLFGSSARPGEVLLHKTLIEVTGEAFGRALVKVAAEQHHPNDAGGQKLNEFIQLHGINKLQTRWHSFVTEQIAPELKPLSGTELLKELGNDSLLSEAQSCPI